jgi:inner membrane transporter RhtA
MLKSILLLLIAMASIQSGATLAKQLFPVVGAAGTSSLRLFFASIIMWAIWRPWKTKLSQVDLKSVAFYGVSLGLMNLLFYFALARIPLGIAVALEFTGPLAVAIFSSKKAIDIVWVVMAGLGIYFLMPAGGADAHLDLLGMALAVGAGFFWALYIVFGKKAGGGNLSGQLAASWGMAFAALIVIPFGVASAGATLLNWNLLPIAICVGIFSSALPYTLEMFALKNIPTSTFGVLMSLEPAIAALAGFIFLSETLTTLQIVAIFCIMLSSLGSSLTAAKPVQMPLE